MRQPLREPELRLSMLEKKWLRLRYRARTFLGAVPPRVALLHIQKCGGTTIFRHFKDNLGASRSGMIAHFDWLDFGRFDANDLSRARNAKFVSGHFGWNALEAVGADAFRFTILREPFARLRSLYLFHRLKPRPDHPVLSLLAEAAQQRSFGDFCLSGEAELRPLIDNAMTRALAEDYDGVRPFNRARALKLAVEHLDQLNCVVKLSDLDEFLPVLAAFTGTIIPRKLGRQNQTAQMRVDVLSRSEFESDERLASLIAQDCLLYEHAFGSEALGIDGSTSDPIMVAPTRLAGRVSKSASRARRPFADLRPRRDVPRPSK